MRAAAISSASDCSPALRKATLGLCSIFFISDAVANSIASSAAVQSAFPVLAEAAAQVGGVQIRHQATIGGNLVRVRAQLRFHRS